MNHLLREVASMDEELKNLQDLLNQGLSISGQGSYERRLPDKNALPILRRALSALRKYSKKEERADVLRALSLAEESLLHYPAAVKALQKSIALSTKVDKKDLKKLALLKEYELKWKSLNLTAGTLDELGSYLSENLAGKACDHSLTLTELWIVNKFGKTSSKTIQALKSAGGFCDCEVLENVI